MAKFTRRKFLLRTAWPASILGAGIITGSFGLIYSGTVKKVFSSLFPGQPKGSTKNLMLNKRSGVIDQIPLQKVKYLPQGRYETVENELLITYKNWRGQEQKAHFNFWRSGIIFENLALTELIKKDKEKEEIEINEERLSKAINVLVRAFEKEGDCKTKERSYSCYNNKNWRLFDLLLLLMTLNNAKEELTFANFRSKISGVSFSGIKIPKRNSWIEYEPDFTNKRNELNKYIKDAKDKLEKRVKNTWVGLDWGLSHGGSNPHRPNFSASG